MTWLGWLLIGTGGVLLYAGMTGQSLVSEVQAVLNGKRVGGAAATGQGAPPSNSSANAAEHSLLGGGGGSNSSANAAEQRARAAAASRAIPYPVVDHGQTVGP